MVLALTATCSFHFIQFDSIQTNTYMLLRWATGSTSSSFGSVLDRMTKFQFRLLSFSISNPSDEFRKSLLLFRFHSTILNLFIQSIEYVLYYRYAVWEMAFRFVRFDTGFGVRARVKPKRRKWNQKESVIDKSDSEKGIENEWRWKTEISNRNEYGKRLRIFLVWFFPSFRFSLWFFFSVWLPSAIVRDWSVIYKL